MNAPEQIHNVSHTQLSIARYYGGCKVFGCYYIYDPENDRLIRDDIHRGMIRDERERDRLASAESRRWIAAADANQGRLFEGEDE